jgi:5-methylcytosine-specific restriction protein A
MKTSNTLHAGDKSPQVLLRPFRVCVCTKVHGLSPACRELDHNAMKKTPRKTIGGAVRRKIWEKYDHLCNYCGAETSLFGSICSPFQSLTPGTVDHVVPISKGGAHDESNYQWLCKPCNCSKRDKIILLIPDAKGDSQ